MHTTLHVVIVDRNAMCHLGMSCDTSEGCVTWSYTHTLRCNVSTWHVLWYVNRVCHMALHPYLEVQLAVGLLLIFSRFEALHRARNRIMLLSSLILLDLQEK